MKILTANGEVDLRSAVPFSEFLSVLDGEVDLREAPVTADALRRIAEYYDYYEMRPMVPLPERATARMVDMVQPWYANYIESFEQAALLDLLVAADYLALKEVLQLGCAFVASRPKEEVVLFLKK